MTNLRFCQVCQFFNFILSSVFVYLILPKFSYWLCAVPMPEVLTEDDERTPTETPPLIPNQSNNEVFFRENNLRFIVPKLRRKLTFLLNNFLIYSTYWKIETNIWRYFVVFLTACNSTKTVENLWRKNEKKSRVLYLPPPFFSHLRNWDVQMCDLLRIYNVPERLIEVVEHDLQDVRNVTDDTLKSIGVTDTEWRSIILHALAPYRAAQKQAKRIRSSESKDEPSEFSAKFHLIFPLSFWYY